MHRRDARRIDVLVPRLAHLLGGRKVDPQLVAPHQALVLLRTLFVHDAARCAHPLHAAGPEVAFVAAVVLVLHAADHHVGHRLEASMRMRREARDIVRRFLGTELVEHQERIERARLPRIEHARELDARAIAGRVALVDGDDGAEGHAIVGRRCWACWKVRDEKAAVPRLFAQVSVPHKPRLHGALTPSSLGDLS